MEHLRKARKQRVTTGSGFGQSATARAKRESAKSPASIRNRLTVNLEEVLIDKQPSDTRSAISPNGRPTRRPHARGTMIRKVFTKSRDAAVTSDHWHVVHAEWCGECTPDPVFARSITSEHDDRNQAAGAAKKLKSGLRAVTAARPAEQRDQVFVRPPGFLSLKLAVRSRKDGQD
jgi:hypothetical protein